MSFTSAFSEGTKTKKALVIGSSGNIGSAATKFLSDNDIHVIAADYDEKTNKNAITKLGLNDADVTLTRVDASDIDNISALINVHQPDIVVSALPPGQLAYNAAFASAKEHTTYVSSNFLTDGAVKGLNTLTEEQTDGSFQSFDAYLEAQGVASEWGKGLDPGLDFWLFEQAIEEFKGGEITKLTSTGAGISEKPEDAYIYTWAGVTNGMGHRPASIIVDSQRVDIDAREKFTADNRDGMSHLTLHDGTEIETYANDDGIFHLIEYAQEQGIDTDHMELAATLTGRHEGHCALWDPLVRQLDILNEENTYPQDVTFNDVLKHRIFIAETRAGKGNFQPFEIDTGNKIHTPVALQSRKNRPTAKDVVEDQMSKVYAREEGKRDRSVIHIEVEGFTASGHPHHKSLEINAYGSDKLDGFTSMQNTVAGTMVESALQLLDQNPKPGLSATKSQNIKPQRIFDSMAAKDMISLSESNDHDEPQIHHGLGL